MVFDNPAICGAVGFPGPGRTKSHRGEPEADARVRSAPGPLGGARVRSARGHAARYGEGYLPAFAGREDFQGRVVHPQHWPADLDHRGRRAVVIGSDATAVTLVPAPRPEVASGAGRQ